MVIAFWSTKSCAYLGSIFIRISESAFFFIKSSPELQSVRQGLDLSNIPFGKRVRFVYLDIRGEKPTPMNQFQRFLILALLLFVNFSVFGQAPQWDRIQTFPKRINSIDFVPSHPDNADVHLENPNYSLSCKAAWRCFKPSWPFSLRLLLIKLSMSS